MRGKLQLVLCDDEGQAATVTDIVTLQRDSTRIEHLGLSLAEAKQLLTTIQQRVLSARWRRFLPCTRPAQPALPHSRSKAIVADRSAPCLARLNSGVRGSSIAAAGAAKRPRFGL